jgi:uncharacterized protein YjiS (DUF1127 family)
MTRVIAFRYAAAPTAPRPGWLSATLRAIAVRLEATFRSPDIRSELWSLSEQQLLDIGLSRSDVGHPADTRLAVLRDSDRSGTSLLYVPRP